MNGFINGFTLQWARKKMGSFCSGFVRKWVHNGLESKWVRNGLLNGFVNGFTLPWAPYHKNDALIWLKALSTLAPPSITCPPGFSDLATSLT